MKILEVAEARAAFTDFDLWRAKTQAAVCAPADIAAAEIILRRLDPPLRTPDAIHIGVALRLGAVLATFDARMAASARSLGVPLAVS